MSIYSGFSTRQIEDNYNQVLLKIISLLQTEILYNIQKEESLPEFPSKKLVIFSNRIMQLINKLKSYEERKYHPPKFSYALSELSNKFQQNHMMKPHYYQMQLNYSSQKLNKIIMKPHVASNVNLEKEIKEKMNKLSQNQIKLEKFIKHQNEEKLKDSQVSSSNSKSELSAYKNFRTNFKNNLKNNNFLQKDFVSPNVAQFEPEKPKLDLIEITSEKQFTYNNSQNTKNDIEESHNESKRFSKKIEGRNPIIFNIQNKFNKTGTSSTKKRIKTQYESNEKTEKNTERYYNIR